MSNFLLNTESIETLANLIGKELNLYCYNNTKRLLTTNEKHDWLRIAKQHGADLNHKNKDYADETIEKAIFKALAELNAIAVAERYERDTTAMQWQKFGVATYSIQNYKTLQCYLYNADYDNTIKTKIYKLLTKLKDKFGEWIISQLADYKNAQWN